LLALTVHEFCHGYFAYRMGDPTAYLAGRLSLNPLKHLDWLGALCLMFAPIGWAKPVPINSLNFTDHRRGVLVSTAAGPGSNLVLAVVFALLIRLIVFLSKGVDASASPMFEQVIGIATVMCYVGVVVNVGLAVFNCLPLYPLDGFHITQQLLSPAARAGFQDTAYYGPFILIGIIVLENATNVDILGKLIRPVVHLYLDYIAGMT